MRPFRYARPRTLTEASELLLSWGERAALLAGGTDLLVRIEKGLCAPEVIVDLKGVKELSDRVELAESFVRVGALARLADLEADSTIAVRLPALTEAVRAIGSVQVRNKGTLVGNICNASPAADTAPPLLVYGAQVRVFGPDGRRTIPISQFFVGPGKTALKPGELVESVDVPCPGTGAGSAFLRLSRRGGMDLAIVNVSCLVTPSGRVRFAFGAVGPTPLLLADGKWGAAAESEPSPNVLFSDELMEQVKPISDVRASAEYRRAMACVLARRALSIAVTRMRKSG